MLPLLVEHLSFAEISGALRLPRSTVDSMALSLYRKLGVSPLSDMIDRGRDLPSAYEELDGLRARLAARQGVCWLRLEDAAGELWSLQSVPEEEIVARVRAMIGRERSVTDRDLEASW